MDHLVVGDEDLFHLTRDAGRDVGDVAFDLRVVGGLDAARLRPRDAAGQGREPDEDREDDRREPTLRRGGLDRGGVRLEVVVGVALKRGGGGSEGGHTPAQCIPHAHPEENHH